ncbi:hypothetical protein EDM68_05555 [Candidatus Uhrbacteria bacterium]|nr:MAG: hypothetical protein EDM68_05555 [Candidatus Uhrbacteria bacterium]
MRRFSSIAARFTLGVLLFQPILFTLTVSAQSVRLVSELVPAQDLANGFNPDLILHDADIFDANGMSLPQLRAFLASRGALGRITVTDIDGAEKSPADVIWRVAHSYKINPKYLLVLLQKEQSLVEHPNPSQRQLDWAMGYGVCDSCSKDDPAIQAFKGFANQIEYAAKQHRERYLIQLLSTGVTISGHAPGRTVLIDGVEVTPQNNATAMLYTYTPHIHGNLNAWRIWRRWFSLNFPEGSLVYSKDAETYYLIRHGQKRPFTSRLAAASMLDITKAITAEQGQLAAYPDGIPLSYPNYSIVETPEGKRYLIVGESKRLIVDDAAFRKLGFSLDDVVEGTEEELLSYVNGRDITVTSEYPTGILARDPKGTIWFVQDGERRKILHPAFLNLYFKGKRAKEMTGAQIDALTHAGVFMLRDGELVKTPDEPAVYVIETGLKRPIMSGEAFEQLGWQWHNIVTLPASLLDSYESGLPVEVQIPPPLLDESIVTLTSSL